MVTEGKKLLGTQKQYELRLSGNWWFSTSGEKSWIKSWYNY